MSKADYKLMALFIFGINIIAIDTCTLKKAEVIRRKIGKAHKFHMGQKLPERTLSKASFCLIMFCFVCCCFVLRPGFTM